jgi:anti-anti-sigma regulatory factor
VEVNLTEVKFMDVVGAKAVLAAIQDARAQGVHVVVRRPRHAGVLVLVEFFVKSDHRGRRFKRCR